MRKFIRIFARAALVTFVLLNVLIAFHAYKLTHYYDLPEDVAAIKKVQAKPGFTDMLFGIKAYKKKNTSPDSSYHPLKIKTTDDLLLEAWLVTVPNAKGTVALFHGHGGNKADLTDEAAAFRRLGYSTIMADFRAHGNSEGHTCTIGYNEAKDVNAVYNCLKQSGEKNIVLWGISLGAATITKAVNDFDISPAKIILEMPFGSLTEAVEGRVKMMGLPAEPLSGLLTFWGGVENGFWAFKIKPSEYVKKIHCPVLLQWGRLDSRVSEKETNTLFKNITATKKLSVYEQSGHQSLYASAPEKWVAEVSAFLQ